MGSKGWGWGRTSGDVSGYRLKKVRANNIGQKSGLESNSFRTHIWAVYCEGHWTRTVIHLRADHMSWRKSPFKYLRLEGWILPSPGLRQQHS